VAFLIAYLGLPIAIWLHSRSLAWTVITLTASISIFGVLVSFAIDHGHAWSRIQLQSVLLVALVAVAVLTFVRHRRHDTGLRRQFAVILLPAIVVGGLVAFVTIRLTTQIAFFAPVGYLMGHFQAEDNAKWLDFTSQLATGQPIVQGVPMGGPLELVLTGFATAMGVFSQILLHGYNQVAVAANTVVLGEYAMAILAPLALAPLAEARLKRPSAGVAQGWVRVPAPLVWLGSGILVTGVALVTEYGHLTWQFTALISVLWVTTFLVASTVPRARLLTSIVMAAGMTVWLPLNVLAVVIIAVAFAVIVARGVRVGWLQLDWLGLALTLVVALGIWQPVRSSLSFLNSGTASALDAWHTAGGGVHGVVASVISGIDETLFAAGGGTEAATPILAALAAVAAVSAFVVMSRQGRTAMDALRMVPVIALVAYAIAVALADQWFTGSGPHYGSLKFMFLTVIVLMAGCLPVGLLLLDPISSRMTMPRWGALLVIAMLLVIDTMVPRTVAAFRPQQWNPAPRFSNNPLSSWWPAEVKLQPDQPIANEPIACVFLPPGATTPSAITDLPDPQHAYSCTRLLAGLSGQDQAAQPVVDWLRREWLTNTPSWSDVHGYLDAMPDAVKRKPVILLDKGSNVIGIEPLASLLARFPATPSS
jgi:hypothetical protein